METLLPQTFKQRVSCCVTNEVDSWLEPKSNRVLCFVYYIWRPQLPCFSQSIPVAEFTDMTQRYELNAALLAFLALYEELSVLIYEKKTGMIRARG